MPGCVWWMCLLLLSATGRCLSAQELEFNRDIRPILANYCFDCHGFDAKHRKADLRLDTPEGATADNDGIAAIRPGNVEGSELWHRILSTDADVVMPPPSTRKIMTDGEKKLLKQWIEEGAQYQKHWAFELPAVDAVPEVRQAEWVRNPIDAFVLRALEREQLRPREEADRETLIRRVSFTLTGLPPTVAEVDTFLADSSENAYEKMVDRFLASPRYGEEQARHWLDVARYADTHGLHLDNEREMWVYRDWVISAFNQNLPFDDFTTWQLAGDLLPQPTLEQKVATGFNRCNVTTSEGGAIADEWLYRYAVDRTSTAMQTWMGLTAGCAVCHDHKFDPVTQKDFYSMYAFFYSTSDPAMDGNIRNTNPFLKVPTAVQKLALEAAQSAESLAKKKLSDAVKSLEFSEQTVVAGSGELQDVSDTIVDDGFPTGTRVRNTSRNDAVWQLDPDFGTRSGRRVLELAFGSQYDLTMDLALIPVTVPAGGQLQFWLRIDAFHPPSAFAVQYDDGKIRRAAWGDLTQLSGAKPDLEMGPLPGSSEWIQVSVPMEKMGSKPNSRIKTLALIQNGGRLWVDDLRVVGRLDPAEDPRSSFQRWWTVSKGGNPAGISGELSTLLTAGPLTNADATKKNQLYQFWLQHVQRISESPVPEARREAHDAELQTIAIDATIPGTFVFGDLEKPRDAFVMLRGQYDKPGEKVEPAVPDAFPALRTADGKPFTAGQRANRLDLARWFLSEENPLTARVTVNRFWQQVFGTGLVRTSDDFGTRGDFPSHPELLDWLAIEFRNQGWDVKALYRLLLSSATFRQRSAIGEELHQRDPENRWLAHGPRFRLDAEQLRDNVLFVSGLADLTMGGRGVLPYQPADIWEPVGYENSNTRFYMQDHGSSLYRRSVYCFLKRTAPPPFMSNFDGPNREQFCTRRERSNTPLQALQLLNDVQHFEAARAMGERALAEGGTSTADRITFLYRSILSRYPDAEERRLVEKAYETQLRFFMQDPESARRAIRNGEAPLRNVAPDPETAAWTMVANLMFNLDETVTRN